MRYLRLLAPITLALLTLPLLVHSQDLKVSPGDNLGEVVQTVAIDDFTMTGGTVQSLDQRDGHDTFKMTDGHIVGVFKNGDLAYFEGGTIGEVDLNQANNEFIMSQDTAVKTRIEGDLLSDRGNDTFTLRGGSIGGRVFTGSGEDRVTVSGLGSKTQVKRLDGGAGNDSLVFQGSQVSIGAYYINWETIRLNDNSHLRLDDTLTLGDATSATGLLAIDTGSSLSSRQGTVTAFTAGQKATVSNAGLIDLSTGNDAQGRLTLNGDYLGDNGTLKLKSVLAGDDAASDRLIVSLGNLSGSTNLQVANFGGVGAATVHNGIQVVEAREGATSSDTAFVQTQTLSAGAYDYRLFKGGVTAGSENSWYLRSTLVAPPAPNAGEPAIPVPVAAPAPGQTALPSLSPGQNLPLYRPEVPVYATAARGAAIIARQALGTFHQRQGDQRLLAGNGALPASWGQAYGGNLRQQWSGTVSPSLDGNLYGFKVGQDLYAQASDSGYRQHMGLYLGHSRLDADVKGFALAVKDRRVGDLKLDGDSVGAYWTLVGPQRWYLDSVLQYTRLDGRARSERGDKLDIEGHAWTASVETGYPIALSQHWTLEPQAQLIAQKTALDSASDSVSRVSHDAQVELTGRLGVRLEGAFEQLAARLLQPYVQLDLWHGDGGRDTLTFDRADKIKTDYRYTSLQFEAGLVAQLSNALSVHGGVWYSGNLDSRQQEASGMNLGVRWQF
ncbi:autotransporter outer membrane beta-barrel domain-containing protein [Pseudomonas entomophila]|uniref:autotransporter family protein n=1 Tax=Pseudomonas entomophila TaxID=312306 RepID=UPI00240654C8|nr:autotransporter outer membrane beta-barrel domain-containing protein [Pseudomonas entomophila]MDF9618056.1 autotransporter outer membrane beta-barrel domain-containing protein [Pseudomonas entomophila]